MRLRRIVEQTTEDDTGKDAERVIHDQSTKQPKATGNHSHRSGSLLCVWRCDLRQASGARPVSSPARRF